VLINLYVSLLPPIRIRYYNSIYHFKFVRSQCLYNTIALFVMDTLGDMPGLPGIFVAGIFSGALRYFLIKKFGPSVN